MITINAWLRYYVQALSIRLVVLHLQPVLKSFLTILYALTALCFERNGQHEVN